MDRGQFGEWLDISMENGKIQGKELAELLGVTPGAVSRWRSGQNVPSTSLLADIATLFDVEPIRLMATAGVPGIAANGIEPLPPPHPRERREKAREELKKLKYLSRDERQALIEAYDRITSQEESVMDRPIHETAEAMRRQKAIRYNGLENYGSNGNPSVYKEERK